MSQNYQLQIEKLKELMVYLQHFDAEIQKVVSGYRSKISVLVEHGLPREVGEKFTSDLYQQSKNLADKNTVLVNEKAIPFVAHNIQLLEQLISRMRM